MASSEIFEYADLIIKGLALLGTAAFFGYKTVSGFNNQNLSLTLRSWRVPHSDGTNNSDRLILSVFIEKGTTAALALEALQARFSWGSAEHEMKIVPIRIERLKIQQSKGSSPRILWSEADGYRPDLYIAPGEKTSFACDTLIPREALCIIDVVAVGRRRRSSFNAQWRASIVVPQRSEIQTLT